MYTVPLQMAPSAMHRSQYSQYTTIIIDYTYMNMKLECSCCNEIKTMKIYSSDSHKCLAVFSKTSPATVDSESYSIYNTLLLKLSIAPAMMDMKKYNNYELYKFELETKHKVSSRNLQVWFKYINARVYNDDIEIRYEPEKKLTTIILKKSTYNEDATIDRISRIFENYHIVFEMEDAEGDKSDYLGVLVEWLAGLVNMKKLRISGNIKLFFDYILKVKFTFENMTS